MSEETRISPDGRARIVTIISCVGLVSFFLHTSSYYFLWPLTVWCSLTVNTSMSSNSSEKDEMVNSGEAETLNNPQQLQEICQRQLIQINSERTLYWNGVKSEVFTTVFLSQSVSDLSPQSRSPLYLTWLKAVPLGQNYSYIWLNRLTDYDWLLCKYI